MTEATRHETVESTYRVIGTRLDRYDATDKVTGRAQYGADIRLPNMLYGKVLRSPHAHAVIRSIDTSAAEKHPGVRAVVTAADLPERGRPNGRCRAKVDRPIFAYQSDNMLAQRQGALFWPCSGCRLRDQRPYRGRSFSTNSRGLCSVATCPERARCDGVRCADLA